MTVHGLDHRLPIGVVADGAARFHDATRQGGLGDDAARPQHILQLVLVDGARAIAQQVEQEFEGLGLRRDRFSGHRELAPRRVQNAVAEPVNL